MKVFLTLLTGIIMITASAFATAPKVLIIGGGPSGLTTAKALENAGLSPTIVEKRTAYTTEGAGIAIPANGSWALEKLGIPLENHALKITQMTFTDDQGEILTAENLTNIHPDGNQFYAIDRTKLNHLLSNSLTQTDLRMGISVTMLNEQKNNIRVMFSDGTSDDFDYVIVADGMHSHTRALLDPNYIVKKVVLALILCYSKIKKAYVHKPLQSRFTSKSYHIPVVRKESEICHVRI